MKRSFFQLTPKDPEGRLSGQDLAAIRRDLEQKNHSVFRRALMVFNPVYLGWAAFDYVLVPEHFGTFFAIRCATTALISSFFFVVGKPAFERYSLHAFWLWIFAIGASIAPMLPIVGNAFIPYVLGLCAVLFGAGALPYWPPRWSLSNMLAIGATALVCFAAWPTAVAPVDAVTAVFVLLTVMAISTTAAHFKYEASVREVVARRRLERAQRTSERLREASRQRAAQLADALERLEALDRVKTDFFASVSHELRTPLTLILAPIEQLLLDSTATNRAGLLVVQRNAARLLVLIDELLDLSRLDAGGLRLNLSEIDLVALVQVLIDNGKPLAEAKSITIDLEVKGRPNDVHADAHRLESVLTNLLGNALKYTPEGGHVRLSIEEHPERVVVQVHDDGPGIPADDLPHVFERFYQVNRADRRKLGGAGIGLALARELAMLHGGTLEVASREGFGTCFTLALQKGRAHLRPAVLERRQRLSLETPTLRRGEDATFDLAKHAVDSAATYGAQLGEQPIETGFFALGRRPRVLLVEDHAELREFIRGLLHGSCDVICAIDGLDGLERAKSHPPDLIVSDVMMPGLSGTELCQHIKRDPLLSTIPVILLTARVGSEATLDAYAHGADDFVAKPFHPGVLIARVRAQLRLRALGLRLAIQEKLETAGSLAGGLAHEIRNPLNAVLNGARVLQRSLAAESHANLLAVVVDGAERIGGVLEALDHHVRPSEPADAGPCDLAHGVRSSLALLQHRLGATTIHSELSSSLLADAPRRPINQVVLNLLDNALRSGATNVWVSVLVNDGQLELQVADDGPGIASDKLERIFDPYFTTRDAGQGSGLGLYISRRIALDAGGSLVASNRSMGGACFHLRLPLASAGEGQPRGAPAVFAAERSA